MNNINNDIMKFNWYITFQGKFIKTVQHFTIVPAYSPMNCQKIYRIENNIDYKLIEIFFQHIFVIQKVRTR